MQTRAHHLRLVDTAELAPNPSHSLTTEQATEHASPARPARPRAKAVRPAAAPPATKRPVAPKPAPKPLVPVVGIADLESYVNEWLVDGECRGHTPATRANYRLTADTLLWYLRDIRAVVCGTPELRGYFQYARSVDPRGRWGNPEAKDPPKNGTVFTHYIRLQAFFRWLVKQDYIPSSPMDPIERPQNRKDQIRPFDEAHVLALIDAAKQGLQPERDQAIIWMLLDAGIRETEICLLKRRDVDLTRRCLTIVVGKGRKLRTVYFGAKLSRALWSYLRTVALEDDDPLFPSGPGPAKGQHMSRSGMLQLFHRLRDRAGIKGVRCSPHTMRHTMALWFLRSGGTLEGLQMRLGHETLEMALEYVKLSQADLASHARYSPADRLAKGKR